MILDRRRFILAGAISASLIALPAWARFGQGFTHNVASGEPGPNSVLLWTRYVATGGSSRLTAEIAETADFARIISGGSVDAAPERDHIAKIALGGLAPDRWYYYRFVAADGNMSPVGRTRTLPTGTCRQFNLGVFSCANLPFGYFNAYAHAAQRQDIDLMLHLGDYIYEYPRGTYPSMDEAVADRRIEPAGEIVHLADYRLRYASYRADRDLQALHQRFPMVMMWDDHESANDSWQGGAQNHDPLREGEWAARKRAAMQAYREWMPVSDAGWAEYAIGDLATIFRPETRLIARSRQPDLGAAILGQADPVAAMKRFRDSVWSDPARSMMGSEQEAWLADGFRRSARRARWQLLAQQTVMGFENMPADIAGWVPPGAPDYMKALATFAPVAAKLGLPHYMDNWNGYPAARSRLLRSALDADADLLILSGDSHNAWAYELREAGQPAAVEFGGHSVTSPGYESYFPNVAPADVARGIVAASPELKWADTAQRGYMTVSLTPDAATAEWLFLDTIQAPSTKLAGSHRAKVAARSRRLA